MKKRIVGKMFEFPVIIEKDESGYFASCPLLQGCYTQGETYEEVLENLRDDMRLHIKDRLEAEEEIPSVQNVALTTVKVRA